MKDILQHLETLSIAVPEAPGFANAVRRRIPATPPARPAWRYLLLPRPALTLSALAAGVLVAIGLWMFIAGQASTAYAAAIETIQKSRSFTATEMRDGVEYSRVISAEEVGAREERRTGEISIYNRRTRTLLILEPSWRTATITHFNNDRTPDATAWLRGLSAGRARSVGESTISGQKVTGLRVKQTLPGLGFEAEITLWVEPKTHLPVQIDMKPLNPPAGAGVPQLWVFADIHWDIPLDESLFDASETAVPAGYKIVQIKPGPTSAPTPRPRG